MCDFVPIPCHLPCCSCPGVAQAYGVYNQSFYDRSLAPKQRLSLSATTEAEVNAINTVFTAHYHGCFLLSNLYHWFLSR